MADWEGKSWAGVVVVYRFIVWVGFPVCMFRVVMVVSDW